MDLLQEGRLPHTGFARIVGRCDTPVCHMIHTFDAYTLLDELISLAILACRLVCSVRVFRDSLIKTQVLWRSLRTVSFGSLEGAKSLPFRVILTNVVDYASMYCLRQWEKVSHSADSRPHTS